jgi:hypothetical protein
VTGIEVAVGMLIAWAVRKARRVGDGVDKEVDTVLDAGLDKLHTVIASKLGGDTALEKLRIEAGGTGDVADRTRQRVQLALEDATEDDPAFANALDAAVQDVRAAEPAAAQAGERGVAAAGDVTISADRGSIAAATMGDVTLGGVWPDPRQPGRITS